MKLLKHLFDKHLSETLMVLALLIVSVYFFANKAPAFTGDLEAPTGLSAEMSGTDFPPPPSRIN